MSDINREAVGQMVAHCRLLMEHYETGVGEYAMVSARSVLNELGFEADVDEILQHIAAGGFNYCLDPSIAMKSQIDGEVIHPSREACTWGADQLESRLRFIS
jgi:hypothetical protein